MPDPRSFVVALLRRVMTQPARLSARPLSPTSTPDAGLSRSATTTHDNATTHRNASMGDEAATRHEVSTSGRRR